ncbi:hypothetical protein ACE6H2_014944 [Prunus campanulata]
MTMAHSNVFPVTLFFFSVFISLSKAQIVPAIYVFGDSLADVAEKVGLPTSPPYLSIVSKSNKQKPSFLAGVSFASGGGLESSMAQMNNTFTETEATCYGIGKLNAIAKRLPVSSLCSNKRDYVFWDRFHPTEATHGTWWTNFSVVLQNMHSQRM